MLTRFMNNNHDVLPFGKNTTFSLQISANSIKKARQKYKEALPSLKSVLLHYHIFVNMKFQTTKKGI